MEIFKARCGDVLYPVAFFPVDRVSKGHVLLAFAAERHREHVEINKMVCLLAAAGNELKASHTFCLQLRFKFKVYLNSRLIEFDYTQQGLI